MGVAVPATLPRLSVTSKNVEPVVPFLYQAKASRSERSLGLPDGVKSGHPTVKPIALMRWLCRLVCPPGGTILDPFNGSGTTGCAAVLEGFNFIGIEKDETEGYVEIAKARIAHWEKSGMVTSQKEKKGSGQLSLFEV
jgi:DNA modification methylase